MQIEFNPSRVSNIPATQPVAQGPAASPPGDSVSLDQTNALKTAINSISVVRPEKVESARAAVADPTYPPDEVLKAISTLIAENL